MSKKHPKIIQFRPSFTLSFELGLTQPSTKQFHTADITHTQTSCPFKRIFSDTSLLLDSLLTRFITQFTLIC